MKTLTQYREDIKSLQKKIIDIDTRCANENRDMTDEEIALKNEILDAIGELQKMADVLERQERMTALINKPEKPITLQKPEETKERQKDKFVSFGEQMAAVMRAGLPNARIDPRLYNAATGLNETTPSQGGFLVQQDFAAGLLQDVFATGLLASRCRRVTISGGSNSIKINGLDETSRVAGSRYGGIRSYWADEAEEKTKSKPKFRQIELNLHKLIGLCYATDELLDDAAALESIIRSGFVSEFGFSIDDAIINGTGVGQPLGIMNSGCLVTASKETGQTAATVVTENIVNMYSRLLATSRQNSVWLINQNVEPQLFTMGLAVGTGGQPVYMPPGGLSGQPYASLMGRPVLAIEQCQSLGTAGDIILADFSGGYILAEKGGMQSDMSIHVRFIYDESVFRFVLRIDGQPVRASVLTPYKGGSSYTQSHFICLQTRS